MVDGEIERSPHRRCHAPRKCERHLYALIGDDTLLRSVGGDFTLVTSSSLPEHLDLRVSRSGRVAMLAFSLLLSCDGPCARHDDFDEFVLPRTPITVCAGADRLAVLTTAPDAGATLFMQRADAGWSFQTLVNAREPMQCARMLDDSVFIAAEGSMLHVFADGGIVADGPQEHAWLELDTDGTRLLAGSARGALAERNEAGEWSLTQQFDSQVTAVALSSSGSWAFERNGSACRDELGWSAGGALPNDLTEIESASIEGARLYVGGTQTDGGAGVRFTSLR